jgi:hypothetical protein
MDLPNDVGARQNQQVVVTLEVTGPVREPLAAEIRLLEPVALDHGSHGAIEHENSLGKGRREQIG